MADNTNRAGAPYGSLLENPSNLPSILNALFEGVYFVDADRQIQDWSAGATALTGFTCEEVLHRHCADNILVHVDETGNGLCQGRCPLQDTIKDGQARQSRVFLRHKQGYRVPVTIRTIAVRDADSNIIGAVETFREIVEADQWKARISELERAAYIDALTAIPNRRFVEEQIERLLREFRTTDERFAVLMIDADHFKSVNDTYGHDVGDRVLCNVACTLMNTLRGRDILGRWGGDEFVMLLANANEQQCAVLAERACNLVAQTATPTPEGHLNLRISIGAGLCAPGDDIARLLKRADEQLYHVKEHSRGRWAVA